MQRALTVKGEEARWIKKGGQRDINGNGEGRGKIHSPATSFPLYPFQETADKAGLYKLIHSSF